MTTISYEVILGNGDKQIVKTLSEAQELVHTSGGSYQIKYQTVMTACEAYCRKGYRMPGTQS